jgi:K+-transporting ATPase ATPase C chain
MTTNGWLQLGLLVFTVLTGLVYPFAVTGLAAVCCVGPAQGSLIARNNRVVGSKLLGQTFDQPRYFWARPSATTPQPNNGLASGGSNLGPTNPAQLDAVRARGLSPQSVAKLITAHTRLRQWGIFGEPRVNVLELNLALDGP